MPNSQEIAAVVLKGTVSQFANHDASSAEKPQIIQLADSKPLIFHKDGAIEPITLAQFKKLSDEIKEHPEIHIATVLEPQMGAIITSQSFDDIAGVSPLTGIFQVNFSQEDGGSEHLYVIVVAKSAADLQRILDGLIFPPLEKNGTLLSQ